MRQRSLRAIRHGSAADAHSRSLIAVCCTRITGMHRTQNRPRVHRTPRASPGRLTSYALRLIALLSFSWPPRSFQSSLPAARGVWSKTRPPAADGRSCPVRRSMHWRVPRFSERSLLAQVQARTHPRGGRWARMVQRREQARCQAPRCSRRRCGRGSRTMSSRSSRRQTRPTSPIRLSRLARSRPRHRLGMAGAARGAMATRHRRRVAHGGLLLRRAQATGLADCGARRDRRSSERVLRLGSRTADGVAGGGTNGRTRPGRARAARR